MLFGVYLDEVKEKGLESYQARSAQGMRCRPLFLCTAQTPPVITHKARADNSRSGSFS